MEGKVIDTVLYRIGKAYEAAKDAPRVVDEERMQQFEQAQETAAVLFKDDIDNGLKFEIDEDKVSGCGNICLRSGKIIITNCSGFADVLSEADECSATPFTDGNVEFCATFAGIYKRPDDGGAK